ncbi:unnamed protein product [Calicophoron daubneyi]|uniref:Uncharacterized protein n=1 Tax=Calicophoron daubneyi TaxID=300641 RepID=A0AAV2TQX0_CALDB
MECGVSVREHVNSCDKSERSFKHRPAIFDGDGLEISVCFSNTLITIGDYSPPEPYMLFMNGSSLSEPQSQRHSLFEVTGPSKSYQIPGYFPDHYVYRPFIQPENYMQTSYKDAAPKSDTKNQPSPYLKPRSESASEEIIEHLLPHYRSHERPNEDSPHPTVVRVFIHVLAITSIDVVQMEFTVDLYLRQQWQDTRLAWESVPRLNRFKNSILLTEQKNRLWIPDLFFRNGKKGFMHDMSVPNYLIRVESNGNVLYSQKITMILSCSMYLKKFPMDRQECTMNLGSYGFTLDELKFVWRDPNPVTISDQMQLLEFGRPKEARTLDCTQNGTTSTGTYSCLVLIFPLQRMVWSYVVTTYIPEMLIVLVSWLGFWIDVKAVPARVTLGLLTLLGLLTEGSTVSSKLPRVTYVKAIDVWIIACLLFVIGALAEFALAYVLARDDGGNEWEQDVRVVIQECLTESLGQTRCCCCYTKNSKHKPLGGNVASGSTYSLPTKKPKRMKEGLLKNPSELIPLLPDSPYLSSMARCQACESIQASCCKCPLCIRLRCPRAPSASTPQEEEPSNLPERRHSQPSEMQFTQRKHIVIREPPRSDHKRRRINARPFTKGTVSSKPGKSVLKSVRSSPSLITNPTHSGGIQRPLPLTQLSKTRVQCNGNSCPNPKQRSSFFRSLFRFTHPSRTLRKKRNPSGGNDQFGPVRSKQSEMFDSEIDAYSRFLFPALFLLFNCCYWLFYLIIADDQPKSV